MLSVNTIQPISVPEKKWQNTNARVAVSMFPGQILEYVKHTTPNQIFRLESWLHILLWRWYFLVQESLETSPYLYLDQLRTFESWPANGQFLPTAQITFDEGKLGVTLDLEYYDFSSQPLLHDLNHNQCMFPQDTQYQKILTQMHDGLSSEPEFVKQTKKNQKISVSVAQVRRICEHIFDTWYLQSPLFHTYWSIEEWHFFWQEMCSELYAAGSIDGDTFSDKLIKKIRTKLPEFAFTKAELAEIDSHQSGFGDSKMFIATSDHLEDEMKVKSHYFLWIECGMYFTLPFSWYLWVLAPVFTSQENFIQDIHLFLDQKDADLLPLLNPFTEIVCTPFGKKVFKEKLWA